MAILLAKKHFFTFLAKMIYFSKNCAPSAKISFPINIFFLYNNLGYRDPIHKISTKMRAKWPFYGQKHVFFTFWLKLQNFQKIAHFQRKWIFLWTIFFVYNTLGYRDALHEISAKLSERRPFYGQKRIFSLFWLKLPLFQKIAPLRRK